MYQFIHVETYAENVSLKAISRRTIINSKGKLNGGTKSLLNVRQVIAEASREIGACPHVPFPLKPTKLFGLDLDEVERMALASKMDQADSIGRNLRLDTPILLAGITSYPNEEYLSAPHKFEKWKNDTINWLKIKYGNNLKNVTLHLDEENPHLHWYAVSPNGRAKSLHSGYQADSLVNKNDNKSRYLAYTSGMRLFQDNYFSEVASKNGMQRDGPNRVRDSRAVSKAKKANALLLQNKINELEEKERLIEATVAKILDNRLEQHRQETEEMSKIIIADAVKKSDDIINATKIQKNNILSNARKESESIRRVAITWSKNSLEQKRMLADEKTKVNKLDALLKTSNEKVDYFVIVIRELERKLETSNNKIKIN